MNQSSDIERKFNDIVQSGDLSTTMVLGYYQCMTCMFAKPPSDANKRPTIEHVEQKHSGKGTVVTPGKPKAGSSTLPNLEASSFPRGRVSNRGGLGNSEAFWLDAEKLCRDGYLKDDSNFWRCAQAGCRQLSCQAPEKQGVVIKHAWEHFRTQRPSGVLQAFRGRTKNKASRMPRNLKEFARRYSLIADPKIDDSSEHISNRIGYPDNWWINAKKLCKDGYLADDTLFWRCAQAGCRHFECQAFDKQDVVIQHAWEHYQARGKNCTLISFKIKYTLPGRNGSSTNIVSPQSGNRSRQAFIASAMSKENAHSGTASPTAGNPTRPPMSRSGTGSSRRSNVASRQLATIPAFDPVSDRTLHYINNVSTFVKVDGGRAVYRPSNAPEVPVKNLSFAGLIAASEESGKYALMEDGQVLRNPNCGCWN